MNICIIDNYDSFTYNLSHAIKSLGAETTVLRNDKFNIADLAKYDKLVLSPGPGIPSEAGLLTEVVRQYAGKKPMLGVCLGEQAIGEVFGAKLVNLPEVYHGVQTPVGIIADDYIFANLPKEIKAGRYHSWAVSGEGFPAELEVTARSKDGCIMALRHKSLDVHGIQFHPESVLTPDGLEIIGNFINH